MLGVGLGVDSKYILIADSDSLHIDVSKTVKFQTFAPNVSELCSLIDQ